MHTIRLSWIALASLAFLAAGAQAADPIACKVLKTTDKARYQRECVKPAPKPNPSKPTGQVAKPVPKIPYMMEVKDAQGLAQVRRIWGVSLQWVETYFDDQFGRARTVERNGYLHLTGEHKSPATGATVSIDGDVIYVDKTKIIVRGTIRITKAPADQPDCVKTGDFSFTEYGYGRKYWRNDEQICANRKVTDDLDIYW